jgi:hypothetical protein
MSLAAVKGAPENRTHLPIGHAGTAVCAIAAAGHQLAHGTTSTAERSTAVLCSGALPRGVEHDDLIDTLKILLLVEFTAITRPSHPGPTAAGRSLQDIRIARDAIRGFPVHATESRDGARTPAATAI